MTIHIHKLEGCAPTPLAHYLKALAILRLVSAQADADTRGWWKDEAFWLSTKLSREDLLRFFLEDYRPTPMLSRLCPDSRGCPVSETAARKVCGADVGESWPVWVGRKTIPCSGYQNRHLPCESSPHEAERNHA